MGKFIPTPLKDLIIFSFLLITLIYGSFSLLLESLRTIIPFGIIIVLLLISAGYFLRVPPPSKEQVEAIVGAEPDFVTVNGNGGRGNNVMTTVAHRGAGLDAPENTLVAFKMCMEKGCDAIEFDVSLTKDEVPIVFHDQTLERMADLNVGVQDHKWAELSHIDISVKHAYRERFSKTNIPTLDQTVNQLLASGQRMFIDIKDNNYKFVGIIRGLFEKHPELYSRAVVSSFYPNIIYWLRKHDPKIVCSLAWRPHAFAYDSYTYPQGKGNARSTKWYIHYFLELCDILHAWALPYVTYYILGLSIILLHKDAISPKAVLDWKERDVRVICWTANTPTEKQYMAKTLKITYLTDTLTGEGTTHNMMNGI